jgi:hypothetical protein
LIVGFALTPTNPISKTSLGFGMLLIFYQIKRYLLVIGGEDNQTFLLFAVLEKAAPRVLYFLISILPVLLGYVLCGTIMFGGKLRLFETCSATLSTLFCIANGDSMVNIFEAVYWSDGWLGYVYLYSWCSLVIFVIVNIFLVIVQQTYEDIIRHSCHEENIDCAAQDVQDDKDSNSQGMNNDSTNQTKMNKANMNDIDGANGDGDGSRRMGVIGEDEVLGETKSNLIDEAEMIPMSNKKKMTRMSSISSPNLQSDYRSSSNNTAYHERTRHHGGHGGHGHHRHHRGVSGSMSNSTFVPPLPRVRGVSFSGMAPGSLSTPSRMRSSEFDNLVMYIDSS